MDTPLSIETRGLTKRFGRRTAVSDLDLAIPRGCSFGFLGHNGAGKTTVIRLLVGLTHPDAGTILLDGRPLTRQRRDALSRVGAIVEEPHFHGHLTGRENLRVVAAVRGPHTQARIEPALERVGLLDRAGERVRTYSQGMRQRLAIARCLLADPQLVILDEPTNGLDPTAILGLRHLVRGLVDEGRTVFVSSHLLGEVERMCDAVAVIERGRLVWQGRIEDLRRGDGTHYVVDCDDPRTATQVLAGHPAVTDVAVVGGSACITLASPESAGLIAGALAAAGVRVSRLAPVEVSLEDRFLRLTGVSGGQR